MTRLLLDENVDLRVGHFLRDLGHDVQSIAVDHSRALSDRNVLSIALNERRVLLTADRDFGELVVKEGLPHAAVLLLRLRSRQLRYVQARVLSALTGIRIVRVSSWL